mmetsp:Transcript_74452/g.206775  ORF Transcript_74452/g.206775 Transcript_74452/m.206775 type:complete len:331 (+) Transcript_74452:51-1043(+)
MHRFLPRALVLSSASGWPQKHPRSPDGPAQLHCHWRIGTSTWAAKSIASAAFSISLTKCAILNWACSTSVQYCRQALIMAPQNCEYSASRWSKRCLNLGSLDECKMSALVWSLKRTSCNTVLSMSNQNAMPASRISLTRRNSRRAENSGCGPGCVFAANSIAPSSLMTPFSSAIVTSPSSPSTVWVEPVPMATSTCFASPLCWVGVAGWSWMAFLGTPGTKKSKSTSSFFQRSDSVELLAGVAILCSLARLARSSINSWVLRLRVPSRSLPQGNDFTTGMSSASTKFSCRACSMRPCNCSPSFEHISIVSSPSLCIPLSQLLTTSRFSNP